MAVHRRVSEANGLTHSDILNGFVRLTYIWTFTDVAAAAQPQDAGDPAPYTVTKEFTKSASKNLGECVLYY
jgi:hypothetical protein